VGAALLSVLSMLWEGSTGETRKALAETLRFDEDPDSVATHYERLGRPLGFQLETDRRGLQMLTANSLWCDDGFALKPDYVNSLYCPGHSGWPTLAVLFCKGGIFLRISQRHSKNDDAILKHSNHL
jgi:serine protease inhibitor